MYIVRQQIRKCIKTSLNQSYVWQNELQNLQVVSPVLIPPKRNFCKEVNMKIRPPKCLEQPLNIPQRLLLGPGPSNCPPRVLQAQSHQVLGHLHKEFTNVMDDVKEGLRYLFQTTSDFVCCISGTGHAGLEATILNLVEPGEKILIANNGIWGERAADIARRQGCLVANLKAEPGKTFALEDFEAAIEKERPAVLFVVQGESSTGVLQPIEGIGSICNRHGVILAVDTVASLGAVPFKMDEWGVDCVYTGTQKVIGAPPSLAPIALSKNAWNKISSRKQSISSFYMDLTHLNNYWGCDGSPRRYHHTGPVNSIYALREALAIISEEGLENVQKRHMQSTEKLHHGLKALGLELFVEEQMSRLPTVTTVVVPESVEWAYITQYLLARNVEISGGLGPTTNKVWRIGLMGYNSKIENVDIVLNLLEEALNSFNKSKL